MNKVIIYSFFLLVAQNMGAQHVYDQGFDLLNDQKYPEAQVFFQEAIENDPHNKTANICYARATGLGGNELEGLRLFSELIEKFPQDYEVELNYAEALMWNKDFLTAKDQYWELLQKDPSNFVANYGYANAQSALKNYDEALSYNAEALVLDPENASAKNARKYILLAKAYDKLLKRDFNESRQWIDTVLLYYPDTKDAYSILSQIKDATRSYVDSHVSFSEDDSTNEAIGFGVNSKLYLNNKLDFKTSFYQRNLEYKLESIKSQQRMFALGAIYHLSPKVELESSFGLSFVSERDKLFATNRIVSIDLRSQIGKRQNLSLKYHNAIYNYSAQLLGQDILLDNYTLTYHLQMHKKLGFYNSFMYTQFSDNNIRKSLFSSLYYNIVIDRMKFGINLSMFSYSIDKSNFYFSPESYRSGEAFLQFQSKKGPSRFSYNMTVSIGQQQINDSALRLSRRFELKCGYRLKDSIHLNIQYLNSNVAQNLVIGAYNFYELRCSLTKSL